MGLTTLSVNSPKSVVAHLVHQAVEEGGGALSIHPELSLGGVVVHLMDVFTPLGAAPNPHHPQELVDVCNTEVPFPSSQLWMVSLGHVQTLSDKILVFAR